MIKDEKVKSITEQLSEVVDDFCNNYCKYPVLYDAEEHDGVELADSGICDRCPIIKLV